MAELDIILVDDKVEDSPAPEEKKDSEDSEDIVIGEFLGDVCQAVATNIKAVGVQEQQADQMKQVAVSEPEVEEKDYVVERILDKKIDVKGRSKYLVKWAKYPSSENTWEPLENLVDCDHALQTYEFKRAESLAVKARNIELGLPIGRPAKKTSNMKKVNDIIGLTVINDEKHFLVSLEDAKNSKCFIRASLANHLFPGKVIDFYVKNISWKQKSD